MRIINDFFMVSVDQKYESKKTKSGIITFNEAWQRDDVVERYAAKRLYGRVESTPLHFNDTVMDLVDPGLPAPRKYLSGDYIQQKFNQGYRKYTRDSYCCSTFEDFEKITIADIAAKTDVRRFDKVYFDMTVTEPENSLGMHKGDFLYKCRVDQIICVVRDGKIIPQGNWCLVEPDMESWDDILMPIPETVGGKILTNEDGTPRMKPKEQWLQTKVQPKARALRGFIRHPRQHDLKDMDLIIYAKIQTVDQVEWLVKIEEKQYYVIDQRDIIAKIESPLKVAA